MDLSQRVEFCYFFRQRWSLILGCIFPANILNLIAWWWWPSLDFWWKDLCLRLFQSLFWRFLKMFSSIPHHRLYSVSRHDLLCYSMSLIFYLSFHNYFLKNLVISLSLAVFKKEWIKLWWSLTLVFVTLLYFENYLTWLKKISKLVIT